MIKKEKFVEYVNALRRWYTWVNKLEDIGITFQANEPENLVEIVYDIILEGDMDFDYDEYAGISWVANWCFAPLDQKGFRRMNQWVILDNAEVLYDFVQEMRELKWPHKIENERYLQ